MFWATLKIVSRFKYRLKSNTGLVDSGSRLLRQARYNLHAQAHLQNRAALYRSKQIVFGFLSKVFGNNTFLEKTAVFYDKIIEIQFRFKEQFLYRRARLNILRKAFLDETEKYRKELAYSTDKQKKALSKTFKDMDWNYADRLLKLYLLKVR
jgi:hypothetical protein